MSSGFTQEACLKLQNFNGLINSTCLLIKLKKKEFLFAKFKIQQKKVT